MSPTPSRLWEESDAPPPVPPYPQALGVPLQLGWGMALTRKNLICFCLCRLLLCVMLVQERM